MPSPIRLIACDLDGTFLTTSKQIPEMNRAAIVKARAAGVTVCLASGRGLVTMSPYAADLGLELPIISCNGAYVLGPDGTAIVDRRLSEAGQQAILDYAVSRRLHTHLYTPEEIFFSQEGPRADLYRSRTGAIATILDLDGMRSVPATKLLFVDDPAENERHHAELGPILAGLEIEIVRSEPDYIEFLPGGISKGFGLEQVATMMSLARHQVAAVGDWLNDLEMLAFAGYSGAVANAHPEIRSLATISVAHHDEGGAAEFIERALNLPFEGILAG